MAHRFGGIPIVPCKWLEPGTVLVSYMTPGQMMHYALLSKKTRASRAGVWKTIEREIADLRIAMCVNLGQENGTTTGE